MVKAKADEEGSYTCLAVNEAGSDSKEFSVTFVGASHISFNRICTSNLQKYAPSFSNRNARCCDLL